MIDVRGDELEETLVTKNTLMQQGALLFGHHF